MADGTFISWIALDGDKIIGTSGMSFVEKPPYFGCPSGKIGLLSSMFTDPAYRRKGIAKELLSRVIAEAKEYGCGTVQITASDMGVKLYTDFGFEHNQNFMQYNLQKKYNFWGWENSDTPTITDEYPGINTPKELYDALSHIWCAYTCAPRLKDSWTKENMTLGQCSITAFLVQDIFGGDVYGIRRPGGNYHCYNVIGKCKFDLTSEQFGMEVLDYENNPIQLRENHFSREEKRLRYEYLKTELKKYIQSF